MYRPSNRILETSSLEAWSHTPSEHSTTAPPSGGSGCVEYAGVGHTMSPQSASPMPRVTARPPG